MTSFTKYAWCFFLASLTLGIWTFPVVAVLVIVNLYIIRKRPKWFS